jgi:sensor histidine kinase YesM
MALNKNGMVAQFWHFDLIELSFQFSLTFLFCLVIFYYNYHRGRRWLRSWSFSWPYLIVNLLILIGFILTGITVQRLFFFHEAYLLGGYGLRFCFCLLLMSLEMRIMYMLETARAHEIENEHLRTAYLRSELQLLKGQLNPHFFFNALSSLSAVVREDPRQAQQYIHHLSRVFRYTLQSSQTNLVPLKEELEAVQSFAELLKMRYEDGFRLNLPEDKTLDSIQIPPMSLQLLVENAIKHNRAAATEPLHVDIFLTGNCLAVSNNLQPIRYPEPGAGIGLANLNERYKILLNREIEIIKTDRDFIVKLPLP